MPYPKLATRVDRTLQPAGRFQCGGNDDGEGPFLDLRGARVVTATPVQCHGCVHIDAEIGRGCFTSLPSPLA